MFRDLLGEECPLHIDKRRTCARRRVKLVFRVVAIAQRSAQARDVQFRGNKIILDVLLLRRRHGRIEFNEDVARLHPLPIVDVNGAHDTSLERLNQLDATAGDDFAGRRCDDIDMSDDCPNQRQAE